MGKERLEGLVQNQYKLAPMWLEMPRKGCKEFSNAPHSIINLRELRCLSFHETEVEDGFGKSIKAHLTSCVQARQKQFGGIQ